MEQQKLNMSLRRRNFLRRFYFFVFGDSGRETLTVLLLPPE
jgi:hypothetical protein